MIKMMMDLSELQRWVEQLVPRERNWIVLIISGEHVQTVRCHTYDVAEIIKEEVTTKWPNSRVLVLSDE